MKNPMGTGPCNPGPAAFTRYPGDMTWFGGPGEDQPVAGPFPSTGVMNADGPFYFATWERENDSPLNPHRVTWAVGQVTLGKTLMVFRNPANGLAAIAVFADHGPGPSGHGFLDLGQNIRDYLGYSGGPIEYRFATPDDRLVGAMTDADIFRAHWLEDVANDRYVWGAQGTLEKDIDPTRESVDCSGATFDNYREAGHAIPRLTADDYYRMTVPRTGEPEVGDLGFLLTDGHAHHVVDYIGHDQWAEARGASVTPNMQIHSTAYNRQRAGWTGPRYFPKITWGRLTEGAPVDEKQRLVVDLMKDSTYIRSKFDVFAHDEELSHAAPEVPSTAAMAKLTKEQKDALVGGAANAARAYFLAELAKLGVK